jgi:hypothetical protein
LGSDVAELRERSIEDLPLLPEWLLALALADVGELSLLRHVRVCSKYSQDIIRQRHGRNRPVTSGITEKKNTICKG